MAAATFHPDPRAKLLQKRRSHLLAGLLCICTLLLLAAGALVTGTGSSLAVPDWPLAYGEFFPPMVGGILYEHGHRMVAASVGLLTIVLGGWLLWVEERRWVKWLGLSAVALVVFQGLLGGITVIFLLPKAVSIGHAMVAHLFFLLTVTIFQVTDPGWDRIRETGAPGRGRRVRIWGLLTLGAILLALFLGAMTRHNEAGLAIPDFPLIFGGFWPPVLSTAVVLHLSHRVLALLVVVAVAGALWEILRAADRPRLLVRPAAALGGLLLVQVALGALTIWSQLAVAVTTLHVTNGALLLGAAGALTLRARKLELAVLAEGA